VEQAIIKQMTSNPEFAKDADALIRGKSTEELVELVRSSEFQKQLQKDLDGIREDWGEDVERALGNILGINKESCALQAVGNFVAIIEATNNNINSDTSRDSFCFKANIDKTQSSVQ